MKSSVRAAEVEWWELLRDNPEYLASVAFAGCPRSAATWKRHVAALKAENLGATLADALSAALSIVTVAVEQDEDGPVSRELDLFVAWVAAEMWRGDCDDA